MTDTKRLSLHGRLRMAATCPDANASLLAEAADAIEQHEAFRQEVSDAAERIVVRPNGISLWAVCKDELFRFIIAKPDPLVEAWQMAFPGNHIEDARDECAKISAAIEKRGGRIIFDGSGA